MRSLEPSKVLATLRKHFRPPKSFLRFASPFELLIATILSARCTDAQVNRTTPKLFARCRTPGEVLALRSGELERLIHSCGTYRVKANFIRALSELLLERFDGKVPSTMAELLTLPGVGRKTAAIVLYAAYGKNESIAVDTHVQRIALRLGLTRKRQPEKIAEDLQRLFPRRDWGRVNTLFISFGRAICTARNRKCEGCFFRDECPSSRVQGGNDRAKN